MTALVSAFARAADRVYARLGETATYAQKPPGTVTKAVTVMVERNLTQYGTTISIQERTAVLSVRSSELALAPRRGDTFTLATGGTVFAVESQLTSDTSIEHKVTAVQR